MIKDRDELVEYLRGWGCPERELDGVINLYFWRDRKYPIDEDVMDGWLEYIGYLVTKTVWHDS